MFYIKHCNGTFTIIDCYLKKETEINLARLSEKLGCPVIKTASNSGKGLKEDGEAAISLAGKNQVAPYSQGEIDLTDKAVVEAADRKGTR